LLKLLARYQCSRSFKKSDEDLKGLVLQFDAVPIPPHFAYFDVDLERGEPEDWAGLAQCRVPSRYIAAKANTKQATRQVEVRDCSPKPRGLNELRGDQKLVGG